MKKYITKFIISIAIMISLLFLFSNKSHTDAGLFLSNIQQIESGGIKDNKGAVGKVYCYYNDAGNDRVYVVITNSGYCSVTVH